MKTTYNFVIQKGTLIEHFESYRDLIDWAIERSDLYSQAHSEMLEIEVELIRGVSISDYLNYHLERILFENDYKFSQVVAG